MAPQPPLGKARAMELVARGALPFVFGTPHPHTMILEQDGVVRIRALVVDPAQADAARAAAAMWTPEQHYALGKPTGTIYAEAATREQLLAHIAAMAWPRDW